MATKHPLERVAFSPGEFAELFGKSQTWGYRQIYAGKVKAITEHGRILIPAAEVNSILRTAGVYDGIKSKPGKTKADIQTLAPKLRNSWSDFLAARRNPNSSGKISQRSLARKTKWPISVAGRQAAVARITGKRPLPAK